MNKMIDVRIASNGRMVLPRSVRDVLGVKGAGVVMLSVEGDEVRLTSMRSGVERAQALYRAHVTADEASDCFLADRRREAARDRDAETGA